jgi:hypothetical protein
MATWAWALEFQPAATDGGSDPAPVPVGDILGASIGYGKAGDALAYSGGSMTLAINNTSSAYTPGGGGTYTTARFLGVTVKLYASVTGAGAPTWTHGPPAAFTGVVTNVSWSYVSAFESRMTVEVSDMLTMLGTLSFADTDSGNGLDIPAGSTAAALTATLVAANAVTTQISQTTISNPSADVGETLQAVVDYGGTAGGLVQLVEQSDGGDVFVRHGLPVAAAPLDYNTLTFRTRGQQPISGAVSGVAELYAVNLWDDSLAETGDEPRPFAAADFASGSALGYSQAEFTSIGGTAQNAAAGATNIDNFGARTIARSGLLAADDTATLSLAQAFLQQYGVDFVAPLAARGIQLPPVVTGDNDGWQLVKYSVGDAATITFQPAGATSTIAISGVVSGVSWQISPASASMVLQLEDGDQTVAFILNSSEFGRLNVNRLG